VAGVFEGEPLKDREKAQALADDVARRLDAISEETERGWKGEALDDGGLRFWREVRGVRESHDLDAALLASLEARRLGAHAAHLREIYGQPAVLLRWNCWRRSSPMAGRASPCSATRGWER